VQSHTHATKQSFATQSKAKTKTTRGAKKAQTISVEGWARPRIRVRPAAPSSNRARAPRRPKDSSDISTKGRAGPQIDRVYTARDGRRGPQVGDKTGRNNKRTQQSEATQRKAKLKQKRHTHTRGAKHALTISAEGWARPRIGARPAASVDLAQPTQGRVAPAQDNAKRSERPRGESGPGEARPASLSRWVGQVAEQRQGRSPEAPKDSTDTNTKGRAENTFR
jgi:hypothetical protein